jgi:hypothetical protein
MDPKIMTATEPDWIRSAISNYREWIESVQGVTIEKMAVLRADNNFTSLAARQILREVRLTKLQRGPTPKLRAEVTSIEYPDGMPPLISAKMLTKSRGMSSDTQPEWEITWGDTPVAIRFERLKGAVVAFELPYCEHDQVHCGPSAASIRLPWYFTQIRHSSQRHRNLNTR